MRGAFVDQGGLFSYIAPEARVPANHPLRKIRELVRDVLGELNRSLGRLYASEGRPSIPPEQLLSALLLQVFYGIRSEHAESGYLYGFPKVASRPPTHPPTQNGGTTLTKIELQRSPWMRGCAAGWRSTGRRRGRLRGLPAVRSLSSRRDLRPRGRLRRARSIVKDHGGELVLDRRCQEAVDQARDGKLPARRFGAQCRDQVSVDLDGSRCGGKSGWDGVSGPTGLRMIGSSMMRHDRPRSGLAEGSLEMTDETAETVCEAFERLTAGNSRFIAAPRTGQAIAIIGGRPIGAAAADAGQAAPAAAHPERTRGA